MSIYAPPSSALIVEPVLVLVLHCSRCNKPFTEYETAGAMYWPSREVIDGAFAAAGSEYDGWVKLGDRYLCGGGCWHRTPDGGVVEEGPVRAIDDAVIVRERAGYASSTEIADVLAELGVARRAAHDLGLPHECGNCEGIDPETCLNRPRVSESHAPGGVGGAGEDASGSRLEAAESAVQR